MINNKPIVSIGLPTYNRAKSLRRAIESALAQDYHNLELIISDNASADETQAICEEFYRRDQRVRYIRQRVNQGAIANFRQVLERAQGEFFMWLADDDWLETSYVTKCVEGFSEHLDYELVCGRARYFKGEEAIFEGDQINAPQDLGTDRVLAYYGQVIWNGAFYGLMRRERLAKFDIPETLGGDILFLASVAFTGKIKTLESVYLNRSITGASQDIKELARKLGLSKFFMKEPHLKIAITALEDIAWRSPVYKSLGRTSRLTLGCKSAVVICRRFSVPIWRNRLRAHTEWWDKMRARIAWLAYIKRAFK